MSLSFSSTFETSASIFSDEAASSSCTSGSGNVMNESPILYLVSIVSGSTEEKANETSLVLTESYRLRLRVQARWRSLRDPPYLSARIT